jgi:hypothetical protein
MIPERALRDRAPEASDSDRWAEQRRRRAEAADVIAETLLEMWLDKERVRRAGCRTDPDDNANR